MKPYTRFLFRRIWHRAVKPTIEVCAVYAVVIGIFYGMGAVQGHEDRKNAAAASEAKMAQRIANKWPELLSQAEYMTGMPATQTERK